MTHDELIKAHFDAFYELQNIKTCMNIAQKDGMSDYLQSEITRSTEEYESIMKRIISIPNKLNNAKVKVY